MRFSTGAILRVTVPATIMRSLCRGLGRKTSAPKRAISNREVLAAIISMAQQASPNVRGHMDDSRAQLNTWSTLVVTIFCSNWFWMKDDISPAFYHWKASLETQGFRGADARGAPGGNQAGAH